MIDRKSALKYLHKAKEMGLLSTKVEVGKCIHESELSSVWLLRNNNDRYVAKMSIAENLVAEKVFYEGWSKQGVKTPVVVNASRATQGLPVSLIVTEFIDKPLLSELPSLDSRVYRELGRALAKMGMAVGEGFGKPKLFEEEKGGSVTFLEDMEEELGVERINLLVTEQMIEERDLDVFEAAKSVLGDDFDKGLRASMAHNDFRPYNIFYGKPLVVFDPNCRFKHYAWDLALTLLKQLFEPGGKQAYDEIFSGYSEVRKVTMETLSAAIYLRGLRMLYSWTKKGDRKAKELSSFLKTHIT